jgi:hypothetical protein
MAKSKSSNFSSFLQEFQTLRSAAANNPPGCGGGRPPRLPLGDIITGLAWHVLQPAGTFSQSIEMLTGVRLADSSLSERRQVAGIQPWLDALDATLRPVAVAAHHPGAFYKGYRLKGVDGTTLAVANTPPMKARGKSKTRRGRAAFHRVCAVAMAELGTHAPTALRIGLNNESEGALAADILQELTDEDLLVADRYYGAGKWAARIDALPSKPMFLLRVQQRFNAQRLRMLADGSWIVRVWDPDNGRWMELREIKARVRRRGKKWVKIRFWTNMLDAVCFPAHELLALYAKRWEQEIAFREIKEYLHENNTLLSHTIITAAQEIVALFMAHAIVTRQRVAAATAHNVPALQISFQKTLQACRNICWLTDVAAPYLSAEILQQIVSAVERQLAERKSCRRRKRSCPRRVRQPVNKWPRLMKNQYDKGEFEYEIRKL